MSNIVTNKIFPYFHSKFSKVIHKQISKVDGVEEVYRHKNKLYVWVKDKEIARNLYDVISTLKDNDIAICTRNLGFKIEEYVVDKEFNIKRFTVDIYFFKGKWSNYSETQKLQELVAFAEDMYDNGYVIDETRFENEKCDSVSSFLSFFVLANGKVENSKKCLIKYIHCTLSKGNDFDEFYQKIADENAMYKISDFPYPLPVINMCYECFKYGSVPRNIYSILCKKQSKKDIYSHYIADRSSFKEHSTVLEENCEYTIYDGNIKIYHNVSSEFEEVLLNYDSWIIKSSIVEQIDCLIVDFYGNIIGYKFRMEAETNACLVLNRTFSGQLEIVDWIYSISDYLFNIIYNVGSLDIVKGKCHFDIEKSLVYMRNSGEFKITNIREFFNLIVADKYLLKVDITVIFFDLYLEYLKKKYGELQDENQFLDKFEVKYLSPVLAEEFINLALKKQINYKAAADSFYKFIDEKKSANRLFYYDSRFEYRASHYDFSFDYEVERKYGLELQKKKQMRVALPDGRLLITFDKIKKVSEIKEEVEALHNKILKKLGDLEDDNVKLVEISEIICSKEIHSNGMYEVIGFVTEPIKGSRLTNEVLLKLNNKDLLKVIGYLFTKFENHYLIPWDAIWMDENFVFYINVFDENFQIKSYSSHNTFVEWQVRELLNRRYNPNAFVDLDFSKDAYELKSYLLGLANSFDAYCDEHGIYYNSENKMCPVCSKTKYFVKKACLMNASVIFEDLYAKHYRIGRRYNLKVYKKTCDKMAEIEANVDMIINDRMKYSIINIGQECFVPCKKAIDENGKFIGYTYEAVMFEEDGATNICSDIKDSLNFKNLHRVKSLIRLILQIKEITASGRGFVKNPFTHVFLSKGHKKQVQILNIDLFGKSVGGEETFKWTCEYVREILDSDDSIEIDISDCSTDLNCIFKKLFDLSKELTKYCNIHKMYYKGSEVFCPKCVSKEQLANIEIMYSSQSRMLQDEPDNEGGESFIFNGIDGVAKVFKEEINTDLKASIILRILKKRAILDESNAQNLKYKFVLPRKLLIDSESHNFFGYTMNKVDGIPLSNLRDKEEVKKLGFSQKDVFQILITVGKGIEVLHANNIYIGDLNGRNILFDTCKNVYFLDFDGMGVDEIAPEFCTDGYIDPVSKKNKNITMKDDWYSFAIQAFYYLTFTHPFNGIYTAIVKGKKQLLDVTDKMERRISLLGEHGMQPPAIAEPWDWMSNELEKAFFKIFEGDSRESIVPYLIAQYNEMYVGDESPLKCVRINPKFVASEQRPFEGRVRSFINHYSAICESGKEYYLNILVSSEGNNVQYEIRFLKCAGIKNVLLSDDKKIAFVIYENEVVAIDLQANSVVYRVKYPSVKFAIVNDSTLYFSGTHDEENFIFKLNALPDGEVEKVRINFLNAQETKQFCIKFNSKFIFVKRALNNVDEIYCNKQKLCDMSYVSENSEYNIIYDDATNKWLIVNSEGKGIIVDGNKGVYEELEIEGIDGINVNNISFNKAMVYIPCEGYLFIINTNDQSTKKMECREIMTPNSKLYDFNTRGFSVMTSQRLYEIRRG